MPRLDSNARHVIVVVATVVVIVCVIITIRDENGEADMKL